MPAGRPTIYFDSFTKKNEALILEAYERGESDVSAIDILGINQDTFYEWMKDERKSKFSECIKKGRIKAQIWWENKGREGMPAGKLNAAIFCFIMKNRFRDTYGEHKSDVNITNNYLDTNVPTRVSKEEWLNNNKDDN